MQKKVPSIQQFKIPANLEQLSISKREIVFYEVQNPRCVVNLLSEAARKAALEIPSKFLSMSTTELRRKVKPVEMDEQLRLSFWDEYFIATDSDRKMRMDAIYSRVCSREQFYHWILGNAERFAYILRPPEDYMLKIRGILDVGLTRLAEILTLPIQDAEGKVDSKLIGQIVTIVSLLDNRVRGSVPQKVMLEGKTMHMNINYEIPKTYEDVNQELKNIEREIAQLQGPVHSEVSEALFSSEEDSPNEQRITVITEKETREASYLEAEATGSSEAQEPFGARTSPPSRQEVLSMGEELFRE